jgi:ABC-type branched-subunit amino acid transport system substrate-binding protein
MQAIQGRVSPRRTLGKVTWAALAAATSAAMAAPALADSISGPGVTDTTITIGFVAPITGLGINYGTSFEDSANAYWTDAAKKGRRIAGRTVKVVAQDDQFRPDQATLACTRFAESAFLIAGWQGGGNQKACAVAATRGGAPYVTRGFDPSVGESPNFFATSPTSIQEAQILARFITQNMGGAGTKVQYVGSSSQAADALIEAFNKAAQQDGLSVAPAQRVAFNGAAAEVAAAALQVKNAGTQVVASSLAPSQLSILFSTWNSQNFYPRLIIYANDQQAASLCQTLKPEQTAALYAPSPWPTAEYVEKVHPGFRTDFKQIAGHEPTSVDVSVWATMELIERMLQVAGPDITRKSFLDKVGNSTVESPLMGPVTYKPGDHQGAHNEYMTRLSCQEQKMLTSSKVSQ